MGLSMAVCQPRPLRILVGRRAGGDLELAEETPGVPQVHSDDDNPARLVLGADPGQRDATPVLAVCPKVLGAGPATRAAGTPVPQFRSCPVVNQPECLVVPRDVPEQFELQSSRNVGLIDHRLRRAKPSLDLCCAWQAGEYVAHRVRSHGRRATYRG